MKSTGADRKRGQNSKRYSLCYFPNDWDACLWEEAADVAEKWPYLEPLAIHVIAGVRPEELVAGQRPIGWSPGVTVKLRSPRRLAIIFTPVKSHHDGFSARRCRAMTMVRHIRVYRKG